MRTEAEVLLEQLNKKHWTMATAESCTGGTIGQLLTAIPGSSAVYRGGVISYCNAIKEKLLLVPAEVLEEHGAVSWQTALAMAAGAAEVLQADVAVSVTGLAGPEGDGSGKPVGLVFVGCRTPNGTAVERYVFPGDREAVRSQAAEAALSLALHIL